MKKTLFSKDGKIREMFLVVDWASYYYDIDDLEQKNGLTLDELISDGWKKIL